MKLSHRLELRDYQELGVTGTLAALNEKPILVLPTGGGKTVCGTAIIERVSVPTLWLTHRKELIEQAADRLQSHGLYVGIIKSGIKPDRFAAIQVASVQTLVRLATWPEPSLIIIDECFPAGTMVDEIPIEFIRVGDTVSSFDEASGNIVAGKVVRTFKKPAPPTMIEIFYGTDHIECTPEHPIYTLHGWKKAKDIAFGDMIYAVPRLARARREKGGFPSLVRVDLVAVSQRKDNAGFAGGNGGNFVYNLEIEKYHTYTANGIIVHNCHHSTADTYGDILKEYPGVPLVGLTATPFRMDGSGLGDIFGTIIAPTSTAELCDRGTLHRPRVWCGKAPDMKGVKMMAGEFDKKEVAKRLRNTELTGDIVATWFERGGGERTVCFAANVEHSNAICEAFNKAGASAEHVDGKTPAKERDAILGRLASHQTQIVSNVGVLTEGWDLPSLACAIIARPTGSLNLHLQMIGRIMRACDGKVGATVLDHAGNHHIHGLVTRPIAFSLKSKAGKFDPLGMRRCARCGMYFEVTIFSCPDCGWAPTRAEAGGRNTPPIKAPGELVEFVEGHAARAELWKHLEAERTAKGLDRLWMAAQFRKKSGVDLEIVCGELFNGADDSQDYKKKIFGKLTIYAAGGNLPVGWVAKEYKRLFGVWPRNVGSEQLKRGAMMAKYNRMMESI